MESGLSLCPMWAPGIELGSSGLQGKHFTPSAISQRSPNGLLFKVLPIGVARIWEPKEEHGKSWNWNSKLGEVHPDSVSASPLRQRSFAPSFGQAKSPSTLSSLS